MEAKLLRITRLSFQWVVASVLTDIQFPRTLPLRFAAVYHQLHRLAFEILRPILLFFTVALIFTLSSRVRQFREGSYI